MTLEDAIKQAQQRMNYGDDVMISISPEVVFVIATWHSKHGAVHSALDGEGMTLAEQVIEAARIIQDDDE